MSIILARFFQEIKGSTYTNIQIFTRILRRELYDVAYDIRNIFGQMKYYVDLVTGFMYSIFVSDVCSYNLCALWNVGFEAGAEIIKNRHFDAKLDQPF